MKHEEVEFGELQGAGLKIGIVRARWNSRFTNSLQEKVVEALKDSGVESEHIFQITVPGCYETVFGAKSLIEQHNLDAVICIGVLVKGATLHFEYISEAVTQGIMNLSLNSGVPVVYGILNCNTMEQAEKRSIGEHNHGYDWGRTAVEMANLK